MNLKIAILQTKLFWESPKENLQLIEKELRSTAASFDLLVLPEMFSTGFSMNTSFAEQMDGDTIEKMKFWASEFNCLISGSLMISEEGSFFNRFLWVSPEGEVSFYDKRHLFSMAKEHLSFSTGKATKVFTLKGWKILPQVCYDLRFPVWSRNTIQNNELNYDVLIYVANWPEKRSFAWKSLLVARAIENQSFVVGVNRIGEDGNGITYSGDSAVLDYLGNQISSIKASEQGLEVVELDKNDLVKYRELFPAYKDADSFIIEKK